MTESEHNYFKFEHELHKDADETVIDFLAVESKLFERMQSCDRLGVLGTLKAEVIPPPDFFDTIEKNLTAKISNYLEYEEPIDECVKYSEDLTQAQWERLESKLDEKLRSVNGLPFWELSTKAPIQEPTSERWETIELQLFSRITSVEQRDNWEILTKTEEIIIPGAAEKTELLFEKNLETATMSPWEQVLKSEMILPYKAWEEHEVKLFSRIEEHLELPKQPFWFIIETYAATLKTAGLLALLLLFVLSGYSGYLFLNRAPEEIVSIVYQMQGEAAIHSELSRIQERSFSSVEGGTVTIVNDHGTVSLQNESNVEFQNVTKKVAKYSVNFKENSSLGRKSTANVAFFVNKNQTRDAFTVITPDYEIIVKGTYFKVEPDISGRVSTQVLEGVVKIHSDEFGDTLLHAGQRMTYDLLRNRYTIHRSGPVIMREEIATTPGIEELSKYQVMTIKSDVSDAEVIIDGKWYGFVPLTIRQSIGQHRILVRKGGFLSVDTTVNIVQGDEVAILDLQLQKIKRQIEYIVNNENNSNSELDTFYTKKENATFSPEFLEEQLPDIDSVNSGDETEIYISAQKAELSGNWKNALALYQEVFISNASSKLRKEDALFSIGKLHAEHESDASEAKQVFLKYLALYPNGSFSGECWLRLAELEFATNPENSIGYYNRFFEMFPRHPRVSELQNRIGVIYLQSKRYDEAVTVLRLALSNSTAAQEDNRKQIYANLYRALEESGDIHGARTLKKEQLVEIR